MSKAAEKKHEDRNARADRMTMYASLEFGAVVRDFCWENRLTFSEAASLALQEFMARYAGKNIPRPPRIPPGPRLRHRR